MLKNTKQHLIEEFFAELLLGDGNWRTAVNIKQEKVIATSDSVFSDTWTIINEKCAIDGLEKLQEELENKPLFSDEILAIKNATRFSKRSVILKSLENAILKTDVNYFNDNT